MNRALGKLTWVELKLVVREPLIVVFALAFPLVVLMVLAGVFDPEPDPDFRGVGGVDYYVPAYLGVVIGAVGMIGLPVHLAAYRERGILRRFRASSVSPWAALGALLATLVPTARAAQAVGLLLFFPMWLLSGAGPPRPIMSSAMRHIGDVLPLTHVVTAIQDPWIGLGTSWDELALLAAILVVGGALAARRLRSV